MPNDPVDKELAQVLRLAVLAERQLHRLRYTIALTDTEYATIRDQLRFQREVASNLAAREDAPRDYGVTHFLATSEEILAALRAAEAHRPYEQRFVALRHWAEGRAASHEAQGQPSRRLASATRRLADHFAWQIEYAATSLSFTAEARARMTNRLLEAYHDALYDLLGDDPDELFSLHTKGGPPCPTIGSCPSS